MLKAVRLMTFGVVVLIGLVVGGCTVDLVNVDGDRSDPLLEQPMLSYLLMTANFEHGAQNLFRTLGLSVKEQQALMELAFQEQEEFLNWKQKWMYEQAPIQPLSSVEIQQQDVEMQNLIMKTNQAAKLLLGLRYSTLRQWIQAWWERHSQWIREEQARGKPLADVGGCLVFATQYNPRQKGSLEVALPDKYVKFANLGWKIPPIFKKYYSNPPYLVTIEYLDKVAPGILVGEVGPWNVDDNY